KDSDAKEPGSASSKNDDSSNSQKEMVPKSSESSVSKEQSKSDNSTIVKETVVSEDQKESSDYDLSSSKSGIKDKIVPSESTALSLGSGHLYDKYLKKLDSLNLKMWPIFVHSILDKEKNSDLLRKSVASSDALKKFDKDIVSLKDLLLVLPKPSNEFDMDIISWVKVLDADLYDSVKSASDKKEFLAYALASL
ncbi:MAG: hypothetical protein ACMXYK_02415, partial [Candidatus Woesearchaeota archaeon]